jgi:RNA-binding protein 39
MDISVEQLLEEEERKANAKAAARSRVQHSIAVSPRRDPQFDRTTPPESHEDRQLRLRNERERGRGSGGGYNSNRYSIEREENDERRSRRSRDLVEEDAVKDGSDKGSANGSVRSRRRSRSPEPRQERRYDRRDPRNQTIPSDQRAYRERGDYYSGGGRRPSPGLDDDRYRPGREGDDPRRDDPRRDRRHPDFDRYRGRDRRRSPEPSSSSKKRTPEPTDDERDRRTVFVQQLVARLRTKKLKDFFEQIGPVVDAQIVKDKVSGRSKG